MTAVMTKADTRLARRGLGDGLWCKTVAGTQTHLFGKSAKFQLLEQGESATGAKYKASSGVQSVLAVFIYVIFRKSEHAWQRPSVCGCC